MSRPDIAHQIKVLWLPFIISTLLRLTKVYAMQTTRQHGRILVGRFVFLQMGQVKAGPGIDSILVLI